MKAKELTRAQPRASCSSWSSELTRELWKARFSNFTNQLDDTAKIRRLRREIARIKTRADAAARAQAEAKCMSREHRQPDRISTSTARQAAAS